MFLDGQQRGGGDLAAGELSGPGVGTGKGPDAQDMLLHRQQICGGDAAVTIGIPVYHAGIGVGAGGVLNGQQLAGGDKGGIGSSLPTAVRHRDGGIRIEAKGKVFEPDMKRPLLAQVARQLNIRYRMGQWLPPKAFKDWNDCLLNRPMEPVISPHKEEREQNLSEQRNKGRKI